MRGRSDARQSDKLRASAPGIDLDGLAEWDPRSACLRAPASSYAGIVLAFARAGLPPHAAAPWAALALAGAAGFATLRRRRPPAALAPDDSAKARSLLEDDA